MNKITFLLASVLVMSGAALAEAAGDDGLIRVVQSTGITGGLIVCVGGSDAGTTMNLRLSDAFLVQGLDTNEQTVCKARAEIQAAGKYGPVTMHTWTAPRLPYVDNCVNILIVTGDAKPARSECMRVLCPNGVLIEQADGQWRKIVKPRPADIDDWTHALYDSGGNAVSKDRVAGPPRRLQWYGGPKWTRHHESMTSFQALVSTKGRIFYILDEGSRASLFLPSDWKLIARDAFNGKILWKRSIPTWVTQLMHYKSGPTQCTRRLVAVGDQVFVTLGLDKGVSVLDAASGRTLRVLDKTAATEEILFHDGILYLMTSDKPNMYPETTRFGKDDWRGQTKWIRAVDPNTGKHLWDLETPVAPMSFAVTDRGVFFHDGKNMRCVDRETGKQRWQTPILLDDVIPTCTTPTLVAYKDVVFFIGGKDQGDYRGVSGHWVSQNLRTFTAMSADTGKVLWGYKTPNTGFECPKDILVVDDLVWIGDIFSSSRSGTFTGRDLHTGEIKRELSPPWDIYWFHQRCYRSKATVRFILPARTGTEFVSPTDGWVSFNHWVRGACMYGIMPANGLLYTPIHPCGCYMESLLHGFNALAPAAKDDKVTSEPKRPRLDKGTDYNAQPAGPAESGQEWPTFRHDARRSGWTRTDIPSTLRKAWTTRVGRNLTAPTVAASKVFVADKDTDAVFALDARTGEAAWQFTAGGRVDSPPTIHNGKVLFGCADGYVYCLSAASGKMIWRYLAAPDLRFLVASEQVESVWPLHGSVLVVGDKLYCVAGRNMFIDGGMRMLCLDISTGRLLKESVLSDVDPTTGKSLQLKMKVLNLPTALSDILSYNGKSIFMKSQKFTLDCQRPVVETSRDPNDQLGPDAHLFAPAGFLDDSGFHRVCMLYGKTYLGGATWNHLAQRDTPAGKMLVFDDSRVYGFARRPDENRWIRALEFHVFAASKDQRKAARSRRGPAENMAPAAPAPKETIVHMRTQDPAERLKVKKSMTATRVIYAWSNYDPDVYVNAMVLANDCLFAAGPKAFRNEDTPEALARWQGKRGGLLNCYSRQDGRLIRTQELPAPSVFDGMAGAYGRLYLSLSDGSVTCLSEVK